MPIAITALDHVVLTVRDLDVAADFYARVLGMRPFRFAGGRRALEFGEQKLNLHEAGAEHLPHALRAAPGSADLCFLTSTPLHEVVAHVEAEGVEVELGPIGADGARWALTSIWVRDPDGNLIELSNRAAP